MTSAGDLDDLAILLESSNDPLAEIEGSPSQPPGDPPQPGLDPAPAPDTEAVSSVSVVQDDNTNKKALLASLDDEPASEVSATAPSPEVPARAPTPTDQLLEDSNTDTPPGAKQAADRMRSFCAPLVHALSITYAAACFCRVRCRACLAYPRPDAAGRGVCGDHVCRRM